MFVLTNHGQLEVWNTKSDLIDYSMQILQPFGINNITNVKTKKATVKYNRFDCMGNQSENKYSEFRQY